MENGLSVKLVIKGTNIKTYKDINSAVFLGVDSESGKAQTLIDDKTKKDIAEVMAASSIENFEDWKRSLRVVISNLALIGVEDEEETDDKEGEAKTKDEEPETEEPEAETDETDKPAATGPVS